MGHEVGLSKISVPKENNTMIITELNVHKFSDSMHKAIKKTCKNKQLIDTELECICGNRVQYKWKYNFLLYHTCIHQYYLL